MRKPKFKPIAAAAITLIPIASSCLPEFEQWHEPAYAEAVVNQMSSGVSCYDPRRGGRNVGSASRARMRRGLPPTTATGADFVAGLTAAVDPKLFGGIADMRRRARNGTSLILFIDTDGRKGPTIGDTRRIATDTGGAIKGTRVDMGVPAGVDTNWCNRWGIKRFTVNVVDPTRIDRSKLVPPTTAPPTSAPTTTAPPTTAPPTTAPPTSAPPTSAPTTSVPIVELTSANGNRVKLNRAQSRSLGKGDDPFSGKGPSLEIVGRNLQPTLAIA